MIVFDTIIEFLPEDAFPDRDWGRGNNPYTAVTEFLKINNQFVVDKAIEDRILITCAPGGFLRRI